MTTYYVSSAGSNSNNGLGPDASHATNKPYLTLSKAFNTGAATLPGDTVYVGPGFNYAQGCIPIAATSSVASPTAIRGDPTNAQGFKDGSGVLLAPAPAWASLRTSAEGTDGAAASSGVLINTGTNNVKGLQVYDLIAETPLSGGSVAFQLSTTATDLLVQDCLIISQQPVVVSAGTPTAGLNLTIRRCEVLGPGGLFQFAINTAAATADADLNVTIEHCLVYGTLTGNLALSAIGVNLAGGVRIKGCTTIQTTSGSIQVRTTALRVSTVTPVTIEGCLCLGGTPVNAGTAGQVTDSGYNRFVQMAPSTNFTVAGTSIAGSIAQQLVFPSLFKWGVQFPRPDIFGWTNLAHANQKDSAWSNTSAGFRGRTVRPWGAGTSIGAFETPSAVLASGKGQLTGGGEVSLHVYLPSAATYTISVLTDSTSYGGTNYPQLIVEPNTSVGLARVTATATDATSQTVSASVTVSGAAFVEVRMVSRSTSVSSTTRFDNLTRA